jgi:hypothetical protein
MAQIKCPTVYMGVLQVELVLSYAIVSCLFPVPGHARVIVADRGVEALGTRRVVASHPPSTRSSGLDKNEPPHKMRCWVPTNGGGRRVRFPTPAPSADSLVFERYAVQIPCAGTGDRVQLDCRAHDDDAREASVDMEWDGWIDL